MISSRLPKSLEANPLARALYAKRGGGASILDLTETNPTRVGITYPKELLAPLSDGRALEYDPQPLGLWSARAAVAADFRRRGIVISADRVALTSSTSEAYALLFKLLCDAGDAVLVPQPSYPLFEHLTRLESITAIPYPLEFHGSWRIDIDALAGAATDRARAILIVSPNNPTGSFSLGGLSKSAGLPQLKLGWIGFGGPSTGVDAALAAYEMIADTYLSVSTPVQSAAAELIEHGTAIRLQILARIRRNLEALRALASTHPAVGVLPVEGGWSAIVEVPKLRSEEALVLELLEKDDVLVHPGYFFDFDREAFVIVSLLVEPSVFDRAIVRLISRAAGAAS
jgi:alanine-synthesizing transaminase